MRTLPLCATGPTVPALLRASRLLYFLTYPAWPQGLNLGHPIIRMRTAKHQKEAVKRNAEFPEMIEFVKDFWKATKSMEWEQCASFGKKEDGNLSHTLTGAFKALTLRHKLSFSASALLVFWAGEVFVVRAVLHITGRFAVSYPWPQHTRYQ